MLLWVPYNFSIHVHILIKISVKNKFSFLFASPAAGGEMKVSMSVK